MQESKRILILIPPPNKKGGITTLYKNLREFFPKNFYYFPRGNRFENFPFGVFIFYPIDLLRYIFKLVSLKPSVIVLNSSFNASNSIRDLFFLTFGKLQKKKTIIFYHGWDRNYKQKLNKSKLSRSIQKRVFNLTDKIIVLSETFIEELHSLGFGKSCFNVNNCFSAELLSCRIDHNWKIKDETFNFLVLSRLEKAKNIDAAIEVFSIIQAEKTLYKNFQLFIVGDGSEMKHLESLVKSRSIKNVYFTGFLDKDEKQKILKQSHFFLNTSLSEGMPISLIEAMTFGLPIFTILSGGIKDFFLNEKMGIGHDKFDINSSVKEITTLISDLDKIKKISAFNIDFASKNFSPKEVSKTLRELFLSE